MTPPIELRTRSPLGECYRSPLGVLGYGPGSEPEPPPAEADWTVTSVESFQPRFGFNTSCQTGAIVGGTFSFVQMRPHTPDDEIDVSAGTGIIAFTNLVNGGQIVWTGYQCRDPFALGSIDDYALQEWSFEFKPYVQLSQDADPTKYAFGSFHAEDAYGGEFIWRVGDPVRVTIGEVPPPPKQVLQGTCSFRDQANLNYIIDYDDCSQSTESGNSQRLALTMDAFRLHPKVSETDFLAWRIVGLTSAATMTVGEFGTTHICGNWDESTGPSRYYRGGRNLRPGNEYLHEYLTNLDKRITNDILIEVYGAQAFGGALPGFVTGEDITVTQP